MVRIVGVDIPDDKRGEIALTHVYGIGRNLAKKILDSTKVGNKKVREWTPNDFQLIHSFITNNLKVEGDLRSEVRLNIKNLVDIRCYRGVRHSLGLPVRGQKTKNNCRTRKGKRKTVANKKKVTK